MLLPMAVFPSSLWPSSIPSYTCPSSSLSLLHQWHLGCFHVLATGNSAVMNLGVHVSFWIMIFFGDYIYKSSGVGLLDHVVTLLFAFQRTSVLFSPVAAPIDIPTNSVGRFLFLHTLSSIYFLFRLNGGYSDWCEGIPQCSFNLHVSDISWALSHVPMGWLSFLEKCLLRASVHTPF